MIDQTLFPETPKSHVFVAANEAHQLRRWDESVAENRLDDLQIAIGDSACAGLLRANEF